jgi:hypothetical protein
MSDRPKSFAERLPDVAVREEEDISHLSDELADILYPGRRPRPFRIGLEFRGYEGDAAAVALARRGSGYRERREGSHVVHEAGFDARQATLARELFELVGPRPGTDVRVDGRRVPYARELWLPLFWLFVGSEA